jgi:hypothetical protein
MLAIQFPEGIVLGRIEERGCMVSQAAEKTVSQLMDEGKRIGRDIVLCADGKYRWTYAVSLYKNPAIFLLVWKIFFFILLAIFGCVMIVDVIEWGTKNLVSNLKFFAFFLIGMTVLVGLGYLLYAAIMGGSYRVLFEMDDKGINHIQVTEQAKKAKAVSALTVAAGIVSKRPTTVGVGINAARTEMYSDFSKVRTVKALPRSHTIKLNGLLSHNEVYAQSEDFNFVLDYILSNCPNLK